MSPHRLPASALLAIGRGAADVPTLLAAARGRVSRTWLLLKAIVVLAEERSHPGAAAAADALAALRGLSATEVLRYPEVSSWASATVRRLMGPDWVTARVDRLAVLPAVAAVSGGTDVEVSVRADPEVRLPGLGRFVLPSPGQTTIVVRAGVAGVAGADWRPVTRIGLDDPVWSVALDDMSDVSGPDHGLGGVLPAESWESVLRAGWWVLDDHPGVADTVAALVRTLVPLPHSTSGPVSAALTTAFGAIALVRPTSGVAFALTLAHESRHVAITAVADLFPLFKDGGEAVFYAPWRSDPRPAFGVLHGIHAHLGVARFWARRLAVGADPAIAEIELARWRSAASLALDALTSAAEPTEAGSLLLTGMADEAAELADIPVSATARAEADTRNHAHLARWEHAHGPAPR
ncbi:HEXXH motif domain-containing protein [Actinokineospora enzanensis]|uniref:HEXXH motif domain-containing protein n=1 Tax=Actinokineospora enzanensis TaxID=155975 RepID=UPI00037A19C7|nr:HEXXH motif domain-containing protein [Actinokineospora enzanensis]